MESSIFSFIRRYSWRQQLIIMALTIATLPLNYAALELPKTIINLGLGDDPNPELFGIVWDQVDLLFALCGLFLGVVLALGGLKYVVNVFAGVVAERMLRRLRYQLFYHVMRFPLPHFRRVSQGELVQMINAEVEPLGGFVGEAVTTPGLQGGLLLISLLFMFMQDWVLGLAALALYPLQIWLIPKLQAKVNALGKQRVRQVRRNAEKISETVGGIRDIHANDTSQYELARFSGQLGAVFDIRLDIYKKKFLIKFLNNFIAQLGPFFFFSIGGYLVLQGSITLGALVAVIGAQKDIVSPWKELLSYYQNVYDVKIKYEQAIMQFMPQGLRAVERLESDPPEPQPDFSSELRVNNLVVRDDADDAIVDGVTFNIDLPRHVAIIGAAGSGKEELSLCLAALLDPYAGRIMVDGLDLVELPESVTGRRITFIGNPASIFSGTLADNLLYGLKHRPAREVADPEARRRYRLEAKRSGNAPYDPEMDWVDYEAAGIEDPGARLAVMSHALAVAALENDIYLIGLRGTLGEPADPALEAQLLEARRDLHATIDGDPRLSRLVERFDIERYNENATIAENLLFGTPVDDRIDVERLAEQPYVIETLKRVGLHDELVQVGFRLAQTMVELFADLPPDHEYFRQFSFISAEELPEYRALIGRVDLQRLDELSDEERQRLLGLSFMLIPARHRLGLVTPELEAKVVEARHAFRRHLPDDLDGAVAFFDFESYNRAASIQDNLLFGKIAYGQAQAAQRIGELMREVLGRLGLRERVVDIGLKSDCGTSGGRLSAVQRQKLAIARAIIKQPDIVVLYDPLGPLDSGEQAKVRDALLEAFRDRTVIWALQNPDWARHFHHVVVLDKGRLVEQGPYDRLRSVAQAPEAATAAD